MMEREGGLGDGQIQRRPRFTSNLPAVKLFRKYEVTEHI
jgi:hypothetical protein